MNNIQVSLTNDTFYSIIGCIPYILMKNIKKYIIILLFIISQSNFLLHSSNSTEQMERNNVGDIKEDTQKITYIEDIEYQQPEKTKRDIYKKKIEKINKKKKEEEKQKNNEYFVIGSEFGTDGFGFSIGYHYKSFGFKLFFSTLKLKNIKFDSNFLTLKTENYGFNFLFYPFRWFHFDIGLHYINNVLYIIAKRNFFILGTDINVDANIDINLGHGFKPYVGIGFDIRLFAQLYLTIDLGILITGDWSIKKFDIDVESQEILKTTFQFENTYEEVRFITGANLPKLSFWPIIRIGLSYKFYI